jgi:hypothetical protein
MVTRLDKAGIVSSGSTAERALNDRFAEKVNVKDFGATGDGVTDDSEAITLALARCVTLWTSEGPGIIEPSNPAVLYFPTGRYECGNKQWNISAIGMSGNHRAPAVTTVCGDGPSLSTIQNGGFLFWTTAQQGAEIFNLGFYRPRVDRPSSPAGTNYDGGTLDTGTFENIGGKASITPWASTAVPPTAIEISSHTRRVNLHDIKIDGYEWGIRDTSGGHCGTQFIRNLEIKGCGTGIYCGSGEFYIRNFYITKNDTCGIHIDARRVGSRIENIQITDGEIHSSGRGLVISQLNTDYRKLGRYTSDFLPPPPSGMWSAEDEWEYDASHYTDPGGDNIWTPWHGPNSNGVVTWESLAPIIPVVFNTRLSQLCLSACTHTEHALKAIRKVPAGTYLYDGDTTTEWAELEFYSQFPAGKYANVEGSGYASQVSNNNTRTFNVKGIIAVPSTNRIVISTTYAKAIPWDPETELSDYVSGDTLATSYVTKGEDLIIGPGCWEGAVDNCRINNMEIDSVKDWRFTDCRLKSGFWMDATVLPCQGISFFGNRQALMQGRWVDGPTKWSTYGDDSEYAAQTVPGGDRVISGPGSTSGWASVELMGSTNDPAKGLSEPKLVMVMPKEGGNIDFTGRPLEFSGVTVDPTGVEIQGQLDKGTEKTLDDDEELQDMGSGTYWITANHTQAPTVGDDETYWLVENHRTAVTPDDRFPIVRGWKVAGYTTTVYGGHIDADGTDTWSRLDHDAP